MSSTPPSGGRLFVEPLEARIAPTGLTGIANNTAFSTDPTYIQYNTAPVPGVKLGFVNAQTQYGVGNGDVFALQLTGGQGTIPGDKLVVFNSATGFGDASTLIQANVGNLVAFFRDKNGDGQVQTNELVGLAISKKSDVLVRGSVDGDVATNLAGDGSLMHDSVGKPGFKITNLDVLGSINGNVLSGGDMNTVAVGGTVHNILAGTAAIGSTFNFTGTAGAVSGTILGGAYKDGKIGASITNLTLTALTAGGRIQAGDGGLGAMGGNVANLDVQGDTDSFSVLGGTGGVGNATTLGGTGGSVDSVTVRGVTNSIANHLITIEGGKGGDNPAFKAGAGGLVTSIFTSFDARNVGNQSADLLAQNFLVHGGDGGDGFKGGAGGDVTNSFIFGSIASDGQASNPEIQVYGGHGGLNTTDGSGKGGNGGSISQVQAQNLDTLSEANASTVLLQGGDGGLGKNGGNVSSVTLLGKNLNVTGGDGTAGFGKGGTGGTLNTINLANLTNLFAASVTLNGGRGGDSGGNGPGGSGGDITGVTLIDSDLVSTTGAPALVINSGTHGDGGNSAGGLGGNGGAVTNVQLNDSGASATVAGTVAAATVRSGIGGDGFLGGGSGGDIGGAARFQFIGSAFSLNMAAGVGGSVRSGGSGDGGAGGNLINVGISNIPDVSNFPTTTTTGRATTVLPTAFANLLGLTATTSAGAGGAGAGAGGAGGVLNGVNVVAGDTIGMHAGDGGAGGTGAAGAGGSVNSSAASALAGSVALTSGNAGASGGGAGAGGNINVFVAQGSAFYTPRVGTQLPVALIPGNITIQAGDGHAGGAGGSITSVGTNTNALNGLPNFGNVTIRSGNGSSGNGVAGAGGDITTFNGFTGLFGTTSLTAGDGGGGAGAAKVGAGGNISRITLEGSDGNFTAAPTQQVTLDAGSAGISGAANQGQPGGSVTTAVIYNLDAGTLVHHVAAGNGSSGLKRGGAGGSITDVHVGTAGDLNADIGIRSSVIAGYDAVTNGVDALTTAGGLFAGIGGTGNTAAKSGLNGNVVNVTANAISSIVAGKAAQPQLVNMIDQIYLAGLGTNTVPRGNSDGSFANFSTANLVGSVYNNGNGPLAAGASTYKPGDGLIAATTITQNRNFTPEAALTFDQNGTLVLADRQQPNPTIINYTPSSVGL